MVQLIIRKKSLTSKTGEQKLRSFEACIKKEMKKKGRLPAGRASAVRILNQHSMCRHWIV